MTIRRTGSILGQSAVYVREHRRLQREIPLLWTQFAHPVVRRICALSLYIEVESLDQRPTWTEGVQCIGAIDTSDTSATSDTVCVGEVRKPRSARGWLSVSSIRNMGPASGQSPRWTSSPPRSGCRWSRDTGMRHKDFVEMLSLRTRSREMRPRNLHFTVAMAGASGATMTSQGEPLQRFSVLSCPVLRTT